MLRIRAYRFIEAVFIIAFVSHWQRQLHGLLMNLVLCVEHVFD